uniref:Serine/threonine-protein kinase BSK1-like TPR repeats domain-containing protein n=1 Tax=Salix viminalis TaxID=40686 RepID=A0A6N2LUG2_SALVM
MTAVVAAAHWLRRVATESVIYSFGTLLHDLLSGKHIPPSHACSRRDLADINEILDNIGIDDQGVANEGLSAVLVIFTFQAITHYHSLSFQMWTDEMQETLNAKKKGDSAFKQKDYRIAIVLHSGFLLISKFSTFFYDLDVGTMVSPAVFARRSFALATLGMENEAHAALEEGTNIEAERNANS